MSPATVPGVSGRPLPPGTIPELSVTGTVRSVGEALGAAWAEALRLRAGTRPVGRTPWWQAAAYRPLVERWAPHLPDLIAAMARGAGVEPEQIATEAPETGGCTSFALAPAATVDGAPISGQTKDVPALRAMQMVVLRACFTDGAPSMLSLTYPGWLFGHGFVTGGCSIYRNALYTGATAGAMPYAVWGLLALHCPDIEQVRKLAQDHAINQSFHATVADEHGGILGIEHGPSGVSFLNPTDGVYVHANSIFSDPDLMAAEEDSGNFRRADSQGRVATLGARLQADRGRLTPQLCCAALMLHDGYPVSVCRHQALDALSGSAIVAEPSHRRMHVTRGPACQNWPTTYSL